MAPTASAETPAPVPARSSTPLGELEEKESVGGRSTPQGAKGGTGASSGASSPRSVRSSVSSLSAAAAGGRRASPVFNKAAAALKRPSVAKPQAQLTDDDWVDSMLGACVSGCG
jgi:hypothetical protein